MADIRCPMCGKPNPDDRDTCQYCQARLKPLIVDSSDEQNTPPNQTPDSSNNAGDWMSDFRSDNPEETNSEESEPASGSADFGDWFSRLDESGTDDAGTAGTPEEPPAEEAPADEATLPDWLSGATETPTSAADQESEPDWLNQSQDQSSQEAGSEETQAGSEGLGVTDWLAGLGSEATPSAEGTGQTSQEDELPDWMKPAAESDISEPAKPPQEEELPDWMREIGGEPAAEEPSVSGAPETEEPAILGDIPDWLNSQAPAAPEEETPSSFAETEAEPDIDWSQSDTPADLPTGVPDWLAEATTPSEEPPAAAPELPEEPAAEEGSADWFSKLGITSEGTVAESTPAFVMSDEDMVPFVSGDQMSADEAGTGDLDSLPDWLSQVSEEQPPAAEQAAPGPAQPSEPAQPAGDDLAPAELPTWLEAMRPVESAAPTTPTPEEGPSTIETAGPLAGLRGVLPVEEEIAHIRKPPVYSVKLQISEAHQARVALLQELVASEGQPKPITPHAIIVPQTALRLVVAFFMFLAVLGAFWISGDLTPGWTALPDPSSVPPALQDLYGQIETLSANTPVLVAFDYDPGFSGEMEASASAVVDHLIEQRVPLVLVSTNPLGPALAQRMVTNQVDELNSRLVGGTPYTTSLFTNLGYIPGGISGLRAFAETPAKILPLPIAGEEIWDTAPLTPSTTLAGFALALVITDNPDSGQAWIEQAAPSLKPSPLLMIVSAQAAPLIQPYYDSGQVQGMIAGIAGGAAYENMRNISGGLASKSWDAFSAALLVATILILIGGLVNASLASMARNKHKGEDQPYA